MFTALICAAIIVVFMGVTIHWLDSAYNDYKEYNETQNKNNDR